MSPVMILITQGSEVRLYSLGVRSRPTATAYFAYKQVSEQM
jgi:hypothetical protein